MACGARFGTAFARLTMAGQRKDLKDPVGEVSALFGPRAELCEGGAYRQFIDLYRDFAREAMRAPKAQRDLQVRLAMAAAQQGPTRVPADEGKQAVTLFRQARSDLHATADDVGISSAPILQQLLDTFERSGPPTPVAPPAPATPPPPKDPNAITIRIPQTALPDWAVISLYEAREHLRSKDTVRAQDKLELVLKWLEQAP